MGAKIPPKWVPPVARVTGVLECDTIAGGWEGGILKFLSFSTRHFKDRFSAPQFF